MYINIDLERDLIKNPYVHLDDINVNVVHTTSGIFIGTNSASYWKSHRKSNHGFGVVSGNGNTFVKNVNFVIDPDNIDAPNITSKYEVG